MNKTITIDCHLEDLLRGYKRARQRIDQAMAIDDYDGAAQWIDERNSYACRIAVCLQARTEITDKARRVAA
jgi:hypothetical protein